MKQEKKGPGKLAVVGLAFMAFVAIGHGKHHHFGLPSLDSFGTAPAGATTASANERLGMHMARKEGWDHAQRQCLNWLWTRESGWSNVADNAKSGAYGIAQALGHGPTNQYPAGPANPPQSSARAQIRWGLGYLTARYGSPCNAWSHEESAGWY